MGTLVGLVIDENPLDVHRVVESLGITEKTQLRVETLVTIIGLIAGDAGLAAGAQAAHKNKRQRQPTKPSYLHPAHT